LYAQGALFKLQAVRSNAAIRFKSQSWKGGVCDSSMSGKQQLNQTLIASICVQKHEGSVSKTKPSLIKGLKERAEVENPDNV